MNFTDEEARAIVDETHRLGKKVAAHCIGSDGIAAALRAGVDTIEHGDGLTDAQMDEMVEERRLLGAHDYSSARTSRPAAAAIGRKWSSWNANFSEGNKERRQDCPRNGCRRL